MKEKLSSPHLLIKTRIFPCFLEYLWTVLILFQNFYWVFDLFKLTLFDLDNWSRDGETEREKGATDDPASPHWPPQPPWSWWPFWPWVVHLFCISWSKSTSEEPQDEASMMDQTGDSRWSDLTSSTIASTVPAPQPIQERDSNWFFFENFRGWSLWFRKVVISE